MGFVLSFLAIPLSDAIGGGLTFAAVAAAGIAGQICTRGLCNRSETPLGMSSITVTGGMGMRGIGGGQTGAGVAMFTSDNASDDILQGEQTLLVPMDTPWQEFTYTFPAGSNLPQRIHITNAGVTPVCVAGITVIRPDGSYITLSGELGRICEADTYESNVRVLPGADDNTPPSCIWIDRNLSNGLRVPGITFDFSSPGASFDEAVLNITSVKDLCHPPFLSTAAAAAPKPNTPGRFASRRQLIDSVTLGNFDFDAQVVKSNHSMSSATRMCETSFSRGPHFVSLAENRFCDMLTRKVHPVCDADMRGSQTRVCFDVDQDELVEIEDAQDDALIEDRVKVNTRGLMKGKKAMKVKVLKSFSDVDVWD